MGKFFKLVARRENYSKVKDFWWLKRLNKKPTAHAWPGQIYPELLDPSKVQKIKRF